MDPIIFRDLRLMLDAQLMVVAFIVIISQEIILLALMHFI